MMNMEAMVMTGDVMEVIVIVAAAALFAALFSKR